MIQFPSELSNYVDYIVVDKEIQLGSIKMEVMGYFPYEVASLFRGLESRHVRREFLSETEHQLRLIGISDNKYVVCFRGPNGDVDVIFFYDNVAYIGTVRDIRGYALSELKLKKVNKIDAVETFTFVDVVAMAKWLNANVPNGLRRAQLMNSGIDHYDEFGKFQITVEL